MKIELQEPFKSKWLKGYLRSMKDGRKLLDLVNCSKHRTTISYARYLFSVNIGYVVPDEFHVDHINEDRTDDRLDNYQLLTPSQHASKNAKFVVLKCPCCNVEFEKPTGIYKQLLKNRTNTFCSRNCNGKYNSEHRNLPISVKKVTDATILDIKKQRASGLTAKQISNATGIPLSSVKRYWK